MSSGELAEFVLSLKIKSHRSTNIRGLQISFCSYYARIHLISIQFNNRTIIKNDAAFKCDILSHAKTLSERNENCKTKPIFLINLSQQRILQTKRGQSAALPAG